MAHEGSQGGGAGKGKHDQVVKPGTASGEIGGITNTNQQTPRGGDKPNKDKQANRQFEPDLPRATQD